jgi:hypothetical protein
MAKAMQEIAKVARRRLGEIDATDKSLGILDRMRHIIDELLFALIARPTSFAKDCAKVICVDGDSKQEEDNDKNLHKDDVSKVKISTINTPHRMTTTTSFYSSVASNLRMGSD